MAMMTGQGPFGNAPAGAFNRRLSGDGLLYLEPSPRRIRGLLGDEVVVDSTRVWLLLEHRRLPRYYFPEADIRRGLLVANGRSSRSQLKGETRHLDLRLGDRVVADGAFTHPAPPPEAPPALAGLVAFYWKALDGWLEEDEPALGHARDPYHRVDAVPSSRHLRVTLDGVVLADSRRTTVIFETAMGPALVLRPPGHPGRAAGWLPGAAPRRPGRRRPGRVLRRARRPGGRRPAPAASPDPVGGPPLVGADGRPGGADLGRVSEVIATR
jgi:uncharacterized protein (DUF427 family)